jgi:rubredoxin
MNAKTWMCVICGWLYNEAEGAPERGIVAGTPWEQVPANWRCPKCGGIKADFEMIEV